MRRTFTLGVFLVLTVPTLSPASTIFADGLTHTLNAPSDDVLVSAGSVLGIGPGAAVASPGVSASGFAVVGMSGGTIAGGLRATSGASLSVGAGTITGGLSFDGTGAGFPALSITGGTITGGGPVPPVAIALGSFLAKATISGGTFSGGPISIASTAGTATISGGDFAGVPRFDLTLAAEARVVFLGASLAFAPTPAGPDSGTLTGLLADGHVLLSFPVRFGPGPSNPAYFVTTAPGRITIGAPTPAPASLVLLATGLAGVGALRIRRMSRPTPIV